MWGVELQRQSEVSLKRQIYRMLRDRILNGKLPAGEALPSTRELAEALKVSRNTVNEAYEMLIVEGFVLSRQGAPTRVAEGLRLEKIAEPALQKEEVPAPAFRADFRTGQPDLQHFPRYQWQQILQKTFKEMPSTEFGYSGPQGLPRLREEIAAWLYRSKGLAVDARDIFITAGATQALHLVAGLLHKEGKKILIEDPCNIGILQTFLHKGYPIAPIPVDEQGLRTEYLNGKEACAVYVTPSHQFPLGGILPAGRRAALIRFARENGLYIMEDDYDSEFRYYGDPVAPLYAMDPGRVIYVGTFSKVLFPALRIGYVILPGALHERWRSLRTYTDVQNPPFEQAALAEFLHTRKLDRHIGKMKKVYGERRQVLLSTLKEYFGDAWSLWGDAAGLHLAIAFPGLRFDDAFMIGSRQNGIRVTPVDHHSIRKGEHANKLLLGYGHLKPDEIRKGIALLHRFMNYKNE
ncbi:MocR-like pyridoxine biosynthesis transcription factor PdxR [Paenibacillus arenilitoris]|uniref:PLP-dependent aminotransferase family protein n=1 Tax=Paenibacillus arenilitoris TaxID=2772299 RepID=A0A927CRU4_9BACL|nr:PLP-dependent aminotransferase family protein [Paenibacillus arenilitoris]MBD2872002.1 PLP-dependent aminotransferase family protein [Paenibacillus arenilitoris]